MSHQSSNHLHRLQLDALRYSSSETQRAQAVSYAWNFVRNCIANGNDDGDNEHGGTNLQAVHDVISTLFATLGPRSDAIRHAVLETLRWSAKVEPCEMRQFLYDLLPTLVMASDDHEHHQAILDTVRALLGKFNPTGMIPVVHCLSQVATDSHQYQLSLLQLLHDALPTVPDMDLHKFINEMLGMVAVQDATWLWGILRKEQRLGRWPTGHGDNSCFVSTARVVMDSFQSNKGEKLALSYLDLLESLRSPGDGDDPGHHSYDPVPLDMVVLLALYRQPQYAGRTDAIFDHWLSSQSIHLFCSFDCLLECLRLEQSSPCAIRHCLVPGLIRVAMRLLVILGLTNSRAKTDTTKESSSGFILCLHALLDTEQQDELVGHLLELSEVSCSTSDSTVISERQDNDTSHLIVDASEAPLLAMTILRRLSETAPRSVMRFKPTLLHRMNDETTTATPAAMRELCLLLISLVRAESASLDDNVSIDPGEMYQLAHKLLFSGAFTGRVARGIVLSTELLLCDNFKDKECLQTWVHAVLLPSTRRMMDPELGSPALTFLKAVRTLKRVPDSTVFTHFKMILANTGLIQIASTYQAATTNKDASIIGYADAAPTVAIPIQSKTRAMIFCVNYFLRHTVNMVGNPARWHFATQWVFELVDTYLQMGRQKAATWRPDGWLMASIEFPTLLSADVTNTLPNEVLDCLVNHFCCFDVNLYQGKAPVPHQHVHQIQKLLDERALHDSLSRFSLSILIGMALSAAVLKNACEHLRKRQGPGANHADTDALCRLVKFQLAKLYDLHAKSERLDMLRTSIRSQPTRGGTGRKRPKNESLGLPSGPLEATSISRRLRSALFESRCTFDTHVLWCILSDRTDEQTIRLCFDELYNAKTQMASDSIASCFRLIAFQASILELHHSMAMSMDEFVHCCCTTSYLLHSIPKLQKGFFSRRHDSSCSGSEGFVAMNTVVRLLKWYIRTLASHLLISYQTEGALDRCAEWCGDQNPKSARTGASTASQLFDYFDSLLSAASNSVVANHLMEILSLIALRGNRSHMKQLCERSWTSLRTVFIDTEIEDETYDFIPWVLVEFERQLESDSSSQDATLLRRLVNRTVTKLCFNSTHLQHGMMRHWGILMAASNTSHREQQVSIMIAELAKLLGSLDTQDRCGSDDLRKLKRHEAPSIMGLEVATIPTYFEVLLRIATASAASLPPGVGEIPSTSPYKAIQETLVQFRKLIELYIKHFIVFPRSCASLVTNVSKEVLTVALSQTNRCVVWRNMQPMLTILERNARKVDPGSLKFLQHFLGEVSANAVGAVVGLCKFWRSLKSTQTKPPQATALRYAAESTGTKIKGVLKAHSLPFMKSVTIPATATADFGQLYELNGGGRSEKESLTPEKEDIDGQSAVSDTTGADNEEQIDMGDGCSSFAADGNWGSNSSCEFSLQCEGVLPRT